MYRPYIKGNVCVSAEIKYCQLEKVAVCSKCLTVKNPYYKEVIALILRNVTWIFFSQCHGSNQQHMYIKNYSISDIIKLTGVTELLLQLL